MHAYVDLQSKFSRLTTYVLVRVHTLVLCYSIRYFAISYIYSAADSQCVATPIDSIVPPPTAATQDLNRRIPRDHVRGDRYRLPFSGGKTTSALIRGFADSRGYGEAERA